jgi:hypothetical protein
MKLSLLLSVSAVYMALLGLGFVLAPVAMEFGTLDPAAPAALIANLRIPGSTFLGIAVLNWVARNAEPSKTLNAIVLGNTVGFGLAGILGVVAALSGGPVVEWAPAIINLLFAGAFFWAGRASMSAAMS